MTKIELTNMCFFSHHGCFEEEQIIGNKFIVNLTVTYDSKRAQKTDNVEDALNYQLLYNEVAAHNLSISAMLSLPKRTDINLYVAILFYIL